MLAVHPSEILSEDKHDQPHGRLVGVRGSSRRRHEFVQVLTLFKLDARVVQAVRAISRLGLSTASRAYESFL